MRAASVPRRRAHPMRCERLEDRMVMSGLPWAAGLAPAPIVSPIADSDWVQITPQTVRTAGSQAAAAIRQDYGFDGTGQTVVVIDTGIAYDHVALGGGFGAGQRVVGGWDFTEENDANPYDDAPAGFHGTHVAGIIGANDPSHAGVAPNVDLVALRVFNDRGTGQVDWIENALRWTHQQRAAFRYPITAVNMSLGTSWNGSQPPAWAAFEDELAALEQDGITVVAAAGNRFASYHQPGLSYPAASPHVIPVASVDANGQLSGFSQRDARVLAAPGEMIVSTVPDFVLGADGVANDWTAATGTSMAAPFITGSSVLVRQAMQWVGNGTITPAAIYRQLFDTADLVYDAATQASYHRVNLPRAIAATMPADEAGSTAQSAANIGTVSDTRQVTGLLTRLDDTDAYRLAAATYGELQVTVSADVPIELIGPDGQSPGPAANQQLTRAVHPGQDYVFSVSAAGQLAKYDVMVELKPSSKVHIDGHVVTVLGTDSDDRIELIAGERFEVRVNGESYWFSADQAWRVEVDGGNGNDQLILHGARGRDSVMLRPGSVEMVSSGFTVLADGFPRIMVYSDGGSDDTVRFYDSANADRFEATPEASRLAGPGYANRAIGFAHVYAYASTDAGDIATLFDSPGDDRYVGRPGSVVLSGVGYANNAIGFQHTYARASSGGVDLARLYDSPGNDRFVARRGSATMTGGSYANEVAGFDRVDGFASSGVDDVAELWGSSGNDLFVGRAAIGYLQGTGYHNQASGFDRMYAYAGGGGNDIVRLYNTIGRDVFWARGDYGALYGSRYYNRVTGFDQISGYTTRGDAAQAELIGGAGEDRLQSWLRGSMNADTAIDDEPGDVGPIAADLLDSLYAAPDQAWLAPTDTPSSPSSTDTLRLAGVHGEQLSSTSGVKLLHTNKLPNRARKTTENKSRMDQISVSILGAVRVVQLDSELTRSVLPLVELAQDISKWRRYNCFAAPKPTSIAPVRASQARSVTPFGARRNTDVPTSIGPVQVAFRHVSRVAHTLVSRPSRHIDNDYIDSLDALFARVDGLVRLEFDQ